MVLKRPARKGTDGCKGRGGGSSPPATPERRSRASSGRSAIRKAGSLPDRKRRGAFVEGPLSGRPSASRLLKRRAPLCRRETKRTLAPPDADDSHSLGIAPVYETKWGVNNFTQKGPVKFGNNTPHVGVVDQGLEALENLRHEPHLDIRNPLVGIPGSNSLEIANGRFSKTDGHQSHVTTYRPSRALASSMAISRPASRSARPVITARMKESSSWTFS